MKKIYLFLFAAFLSGTLLGQTRATLLMESFDGSSIPAGWTIQNQQSNWSVKGSNYAGGMPNELCLYWNPQFNGKTRFVSPVINLTGETAMAFSFSHYLDNYTGSHKLGIETSSDGGVTWTEGWTQNYSGTGQYNVIAEISTSDVGSANFQFCLFFEGNSYNINNWYFDNFELFSFETLDAAVAVNNTTYVATGNHTGEFAISNKGLTTITSLEVQYQYNELPPVVQVFSSLNIASLASQSFTFDQLTNLPAGTYTLGIEILKVNGIADDYAANNRAEKEIYVASQETERFVTIEHFTSSTCGPCVNVNSQMKTLLNNNPDKFGITKYQMNWPGNGDPYYTAEGGVRRSYYGVNAVPQVYFNGKETNVNQTAFDNALAEPAFIAINGTFTMDGEHITVNVEIFPYLTVPSARIYTIVNEKKTTQNVGGNGETEFIHVMMKMLPDANGEAVSMAAGERLTLEYTYNMSATNVEELDDLEVHVFVQNHESKYVFNSKFLTACEVPVEAPKSVTLDHASTDVVVNWLAPDSGADHYTVYFNGEILAENITETTFTHEDVEDGLHTYGVVAFIGGCHSPVAEATIDFVGLISHRQNQVKIYPNPANSTMMIEAQGMNRITVISVLGQVMYDAATDGTSVACLDVSNFESGIYVLSVSSEHGVSTSRITVVR